jgi:hypothetical protein
MQGERGPAGPTGPGILDEDPLVVAGHLALLPARAVLSLAKHAASLPRTLIGSLLRRGR